MLKQREYSFASPECLLKHTVALRPCFSVAMRSPVPSEQVAKSILFLASESWSGNISGQVISVDSGKQGKVLWMKEV